MSPKFSGNQTIRPPVSVVATTSTRTRTHEGGAAWAQDAKTALFTLACANMVSESTFYEAGKTRDQRFVDLIRQVVKEDPAWVAGFVPFLREKMFMRSASIVMAAEYVAAGGPNGRKVIDSACQRADEPAEMLGYWFAVYGKKLPKPVKRGIADAAQRLYTPRNVLRYDGQSRDIRMADVLEQAHPRKSGADQGRLYQWIIDRRHNRDDVGKLGYWSDPDSITEAGRAVREADADELQMIAQKHYLAPVISWDRLQRISQDSRRKLLESRGPALAGMLPSWEMLAGWLNGPMDAKAWEAVIPSMGIMALTRNLRNFDQAGVSDEVADKVMAKLTDPEEVARSRMFPFRWWSAYKNTPSERWSRALGRALDMACSNIPVFKGRTLVVVDVSGSMAAPVSAKSAIARYEIGGVFAGALAKKNPGSVDLVCFGTRNRKVSIDSTASAMRWVQEVEKVMQSGHLDYGTFGHTAIRDHYRGHDRVVMFTDDQMMDSVDNAAQMERTYGSYYTQRRWPRGGADISHVPLLYTVDLAGHGRASTQWGSDGRYGLGGFSDSAFQLIHMVENFQDGTWSTLFGATGQ